jgi:hypothetical protein
VPSEYRLLRTHDGCTSFAKVVVDAQPSSTWTITWDRFTYNDASDPYNGYYNIALEAGASIAVREHELQGGEPKRIEILALYANPVDTREDAVRCATALATWKALGHSESDANVTFEEGEWHITFRQVNGESRE